MYRRLHGHARTVTFQRLWSVVGSKNKDCVFGNSQFVDRIEHPADVVIGLCQDIRKTAIACRTFEFGIGINGFMRLGIWQISKKRFVRVCLPLDEVDCVIGDFVGDVTLLWY